MKRKHGFGIPLVLFAASLSGACASYEGWNAVKSKHFTLYTNTSTQYTDTLRSLEQGYAALSASFFKGQDIGTVEVLFLEDSEFIGQFGSYRKGAALAKVPGGGKIGQDGMLVLRPHTLNYEHDAAPSMDTGADVMRTGSVVKNEAGHAAKEMLAHVFIQRVMPTAPLWFHEGFATYVRNVEIRASGNQVLGCFGYMQYPESHLGLAKMWDLKFDGYAKSEARGWFRSSAHMLIDFVIHGDDGGHRGQLGPLVAGVAAGEPSDKVVIAAFGGKAIDEIDKLVQAHREVVKQGLGTRSEVRGLCPFGIVIPNDKKPEDTISEQSTPAAAGDIEAVFRAISALPAREEYPPYYPIDVINKVKVPPPGS